ncbi:uncharacterized protein L969DRAFT_92944 [Mixia osmundae IAM 14324]|uniref:Phosphoinositide phospholipase C n=1 Tax=Mixia osmundae (strain CBS 9802 / IAM 14324 / JCM 22182 / KY 12970) TaxID=764103 RepID=G7DTU8_MIXOS|nr:uncharacterized protein L969DRAFT_92944 [Mixia osmundae IAM 14324]KEI41722.1 hypothetical protein L969DRAFT_92944 [Mixia osmundae IAM 14324]GAA94008.1 hypothetical protein E5Q_00655 [Mixia osmundae IAM 14324]
MRNARRPLKLPARPREADEADDSDGLTTSPAESWIPARLRQGTLLLKVSAKKAQQRLVKIVPEEGRLLYESRKGGIVNLESIRELRFAEEGRPYRLQFGLPITTEPRWMTLVFSTSIAAKFKMLHFVALSDEAFTLWRDALLRLFNQRARLIGGLDHVRRRQRFFLRQCWSLAVSGFQSADEATASPANIQDDHVRLSFAEVSGICRRLAIGVDLLTLRSYFDLSDRRKDSFLSFTEFQDFVGLLRYRKDVEAIVRQYGQSQKQGTQPLLDYPAFQRFMRDCQKSQMADSALEGLHQKFADPAATLMLDGREKFHMTTEGLTSFLASADNGFIAEREARVHMDMTRPLCEYFINSSHNTYLLGGQLAGNSSVEGYIRALQQGCRSVELDVWDGTDSTSEPVIYHGRTLTTRIEASEAIRAIAKYAFVASSYPVILSLEIHCDNARQARLASLLRDLLGPALVYDRLMTDTNELCDLPSPHELQHRILIKCKTLNKAAPTSGVKSMIQRRSSDLTSSTDTTDANGSDAGLGRAFNNAFRKMRSSSPPRSNTRNPSSRLSSSPERLVASIGSSDAVSALALARLAVYTQGVQGRGFNKKEHYAPTHMISLGERRMLKTIRDARMELIAHSRTHLLRCYPSATRFTSSNFSPLQFWVNGVSMAAMNFQTFDLGYEVNAAFFSTNGTCGYILKPDILRRKGLEKDKDALVRVDTYRLRLVIVSAQQLSRPSDPAEGIGAFVSEDARPISPYVEASVLVPGGRAYRFRSQTIHGNGFNPIFDAVWELDIEVELGLLDFAFLHLCVNDDNDNEVVLGRHTVSLLNLLPGYRHLPLSNHAGQQQLFASLFIHSVVDRI